MSKVWRESKGESSCLSSVSSLAGKIRDRSARTHVAIHTVHNNSTTRLTSPFNLQNMSVHIPHNTGEIE